MSIASTGSESTYDYVVVGAGSAGCALARRLSDRTGARILVLEAGGPDTRPEIHDPTAYYGLWGSEVDWRYETVPQPAAAGRTLLWPRGRVLGGTSSINGMVYLQGDRTDYEHWAYLGNAGWRYEDVKACFRAMEGLDEEGRADAPGLLSPAIVEQRSPLSQVFIDACAEIGIRYNDDFNSGTLAGAGWNQSTIRGGRRQSSYRAFLEPILGRPGLRIDTHAQLLSLDVAANGRVERLTYSRDGEEQVAHVACEVVLCAGAVDSPRLLLLSGIGAAAELESVGVRPVVDLPEVGRNLVDHMLLGIAYGATEPVDNRNPNVTESCAFLASGPGVYGSDIQISFGKEKNFVEGYDVPEHCFTLIPGIVRPESRGSLTLRSADPSVPPLIDPRHLAEEADVQGLVRGIEICREIGATRALRPWTTGEVAPGAQVSDEAGIRNYVRTVASTWFHPAGTCRMGIDSGAVVDPRLRVRGVANLRVADASIMPRIVSSNTNAASTMIGWRAADLLTDDA